MLRKLVAAIIGVSALVPSTVFGLGMGEVELKSFLNQPLEARIELLQTRGLSSAEIIAGLANTKEFTTAGVDRSFFLSQLKFEVVKGENGQTYLKVLSERPVTEPFLNFLVEVQWPAGRLLREYTLLLDPPEFKDALPLAIRAPVAAKERNSISKNSGVQIKEPIEKARDVAVITKADSSSTAQPTSNFKPTEPKPESGGYVAGSTTATQQEFYTVKKGNTLTSIVKDTQGDMTLPMAQSFIAYQYLNPEAFIDGNINLVKRGAVLRIPTESQILKVDRKEALQEIAKQNKTWRAKAIARLSAKKEEQLTGRQLDGTGRDLTPDSTPKNLDEGRLSLVAPGAEKALKDGATGAGDKSGGDVKKVSALKDQLALETEQVEKFSVSNDGLVTELDELASLVDKTDKVLSLKDDQIASLQARLDALQNDAEMAGLESANDPAMGSKPDEIMNDMVASGENADLIDQMPDPMETKDLVEEPIEDVAENDDDQQIPAEFDEAISQPKETPIWANPLYLGTGGALLIAVLGLLWFRSRSEDDDFEDYEEDYEEEAQAKSEPNELGGVNQESSKTQVFSTEQLDRQLLEAESDFDIDTVLSEADIYVAYGHFPKAVAMLKEGLKESPESLGLNLKLMDVYVESKDVDSFKALESVVRGIASDDQTLSQINAMRKNLGLGAGEGPEQVEDEFSEEKTQFLGDEELSSIPQSESDDFLSLADIEAELDVGGGFEETSEAELSSSLGFSAEETEFIAEETQIDAQEQVSSREKEGALGDEALDLSGGALEFNFEETSVPSDTFSEDEAFSPDDALADIDEEIDNLNEDLDNSESASSDDDDLGGLEGLDLGFKSPTTEPDISVDLDADFSLDDNMLEIDATSERQESASTSDNSLSKEEASLLDGVDEVGTKLDLATAYIEMGDQEGAKDILDEVLLEGSAEQQQLARSLLEKTS